jgi:hypothetical protein
MIRYGRDAYKDPASCQIMMGLSSSMGAAWYQSKVALGFKAYGSGAVLDYAFSNVPESLFVGELQEELGRVGLDKCLEACNQSDDCVLVRVKRSSSSSSSSSSSGGGSGSMVDACGLYRGVLDEGWTSLYRIAPENLLEDGAVVDTFP